MIQRASAIVPRIGATNRAAIVASAVSSSTNELRMFDIHQIRNSTNNRPLSNSPIG